MLLNLIFYYQENMVGNDSEDGLSKGGGREAMREKEERNEQQKR